MNDVMVQTEGFSARCQKVLAVARQLHQGKPDWVTFFRETLGVNGAARSVFPSQEEYVKFEQSDEFSEIQKLVAGLRTRRAGSGKNEPTRVITVRLPESLHEALKAEASDHNTSMNKLCISKLLQVLIDNEKQNQAAAAAQTMPNRSATIPMTPAVPTNTHGTSINSAHANPAHNRSALGGDSPANQSPNFRSTYTPPSSANMAPIRRFGQ